MQKNLYVTMFDFEMFWPILHMKQQMKSHTITHFVLVGDNGWYIVIACLEWVSD